MYAISVREFPADATQELREKVLQQIDDNGPRTASEASAVVGPSPVNSRLIAISLAAAATLLAIGIGASIGLRALDIPSDNRAFVYGLIFLPWWWVAPFLLASNLFPDGNVLSVFRRPRFSINYIFFAGIGMMLAFVVSFLLGERTGYIAQDERPRTELIVVAMMVISGLLGGWSAVLRGRSYESDLVQQWLLEWSRSPRAHAKKPNDARDISSGQSASQGSRYPTIAVGPLGACPNCEAVIPLASQDCPKCKASFGPGSAWKVVPR